MSNNAKPFSDLSTLTIPAEDRMAKKSHLGLTLFFILFLGILGGAASYWHFGQTATVAVASVRWTTTTQAVSVLKASGYVTPRRRATIAAKITGRISEMLVEEGDHVKKEQVLAKLDDAEARDAILTNVAELAVADASLSELKILLRDAQTKLLRAQRLHGGSLMSKESLETAQITYDSLEAKLRVAYKQKEAAQTRLKATEQLWTNYTIAAPFEGIVVSKDAQVGEMVSPISAGGGFTRTGIATLVDMQSLEIEVDVNESYIARVKEGQKIEATLDAYPDWKMPGRVRTVIPTADRQKATVKVRILFDRLDPKILPDMGIKVSFLEKEETGNQERFLSIPASAALPEGGKNFVFVFHDDQLEKRSIQIGKSRGAYLEIKSGLVEGEMVVIENVASLQDGQKARRLP